MMAALTPRARDRSATAKWAPDDHWRGEQARAGDAVEHLLEDAYLVSERRIPFNEYGIFRRYPELDG
jgi:hypothetical protein